MLMGGLIEHENKNKIRTENDILYCTIKKVVPLRLEPTFKRTFFILCQSHLPTELCICLWMLIISSLSLINMKRGINTDDKP